MMYYLLIAISMLLGSLTQGYIRSTYAKWEKVDASFSGTGADVARAMLAANGASSVGIVPIAGTLTDNYNPNDNKLHLSSSNLSGGSVASVAVACHEAGHAIQNASGYGLMLFRTQLVPAVNIASQTWFFIFMVGIALNIAGLVNISLILFALSVLFQLVTLPVEIDASKRALSFLDSYGQSIDQQGAREVLTAAALTYVASALVSVLQFLYYASSTRSSRR